MRLRPSLPLALAILTAAFLPAATSNSLDDLLKTVREGLQRGQSDDQVAHAIHHLNLGVRLDNRTSEELESESPGPKSIAEIERLRELSRTLPLSTGLPWFASPPAPARDELRDVLAEARHKALSYTAGLPDFLCTETVRRYESATGKGDWMVRDTLTLQLTYFDHDESYKLTAINGRKTGLSYEQVGGAMSKGEFGSMLYAVFAPASQATFKWLDWTTLRKRPAYVLSFQIQAIHSNYRLAVGRYGGGEVSTVPGEHGFVYIDRETKNVMRVDSESDSIPDDFPLEGATRTLDYGMADVSGREFLLPLHADVRMVPRGRRLLTRNDVEFSGFRKFTGESTISFGDPPDDKPAEDKSKPVPPTKK